MVKRKSESQITRDELEDENEEVSSGSFSRASKSEIAQRKMFKPSKRRYINEKNAVYIYNL